MSTVTASGSRFGEVRDGFDSLVADVGFVPARARAAQARARLERDGAVILDGYPPQPDSLVRAAADVLGTRLRQLFPARLRHDGQDRRRDVNRPQLRKVDAVISAQDISFAYDGTLVLDGVGVSARRGQLVGLIGPNGSGKTTLLRTLYAALTPRAGLVTVDDRPVGSLSPTEVARRISVVAQEGAPELPLTVADTVLLGRSPLRSAFQSYTAADHQAAAAALRRVGARDLAERTFNTLSGGEKQRVLIARTLAQEADHLLLDEPTNHLDIRYQHEILSLVRTLDVTTVVVLHDLNLAARYCDHLVLLDGGTVACSGPTDAVLTPAVLEPVYGIAVRRLVEPDCVQLIFQPYGWKIRNGTEETR